MEGGDGVNVWEGVTLQMTGGTTVGQKKKLILQTDAFTTLFLSKYSNESVNSTAQRYTYM